MKKLRRHLFLAAGILAASLYFAQAQSQVIQCQPSGSVPAPCNTDASGTLEVTTVPGASSGVTAAPVAGTIAVTNTFQALLAAPVSPAIRKGCGVQNQGSANMFVYIGASGQSLIKSLIIPPLSTYSCSNLAGQVEQSALQITGTNPDTYVVWSE